MTRFTKILRDTTALPGIIQTVHIGGITFQGTEEDITKAYTKYFGSVAAANEDARK